MEKEEIEKKITINNRIYDRLRKKYSGRNRLLDKIMRDTYGLKKKLKEFETL